MRHLPIVVLWIALAAGASALVARELSRAWFMPAAEEEVLAALEASMADQRELARLRPESTPDRRSRFDQTLALVKRMRVLSHSRGELVRQHTRIIVVSSVLAAGVAGLLHAWRQQRRDIRTVRLQRALEQLAIGIPDVRVGDAARDTLGRIARTVEELSARHARDRQRLASLEDLSRWQEAARRHAHEMRTPLSAARLDLERLRDTLQGLEGAPRTALDATVAELEADLKRLGEFAQAFGDFGRLPPPRPVSRDLAAELREFAARFAGAWPRLTLRVEAPAGACPASFDPELLRQVLVNLCENASAAVADQGTVTITLAPGPAGGWSVTVADDGPGIPPEAQGHLFQPYATFRAGGTGLGLAVSRKILLDHGGDLQWIPTARGASFRLALPASPVASAA
jgi:two-component system nitrogen regulation sensor histidine kinase NtrY